MSNELELVAGIMLFLGAYIAYRVLLKKGEKEGKFSYGLIATAILIVFFFLAGQIVRNAW